MSEGKNIMIPEQNQLDNWFDKLIFEEKVKMLFGDCFLKIREIPDNSVDLIVTDQEQEYEARLKEYNRQNAELEKQRKEFYEANPDFPIKTMYMQVTAPPQKVSIREVR